jgi:hypothetical protein
MRSASRSLRTIGSGVCRLRFTSMVLLSPIVHGLKDSHTRRTELRGRASLSVYPEPERSVRFRLTERTDHRTTTIVRFNEERLLLFRPLA